MVDVSEAIRFPVAGMTCSSCVGHIIKAAGRVPGVEKVRVDLAGETATICRDPALASDAAIAAALDEAGYQADIAAAVIVPTDDRTGLIARLFRRTGA